MGRSFFLENREYILYHVYQERRVYNMRELLLESREVTGEGKRLRCRYLILVGEKKIGDFSCEDYGVKVVNEATGESAEFPDLTVSAARIDELMELLVRNGVTPAGLEDVIADWL